MPGDSLVQSISRADEILKLLARTEHPLSVPEISSTTGLLPPTVFNMLRTLIHDGMVEKKKLGTSATYVLGGRLEELYGSRLRSKLTSWLEVVLHEVERESHADQVSYVEYKEDGFYVVCRLSAGGELEKPEEWMVHPYASCGALMLTSSMAPEFLEGMRQKIPFAKYGTTTWETEEEYRNALDKARWDGYLLVGDPLVSGEIDIAVPVFGEFGEIMGALVVHWGSYSANSVISENVNILKKFAASYRRQEEKS